MARAGLVELRRAGEVWHKRVDELTPGDCRARMEAERTTRAWLSGGIGGGRFVAA